MKVVRSSLFILGILSLVLGIIGIFLPLIPTTPFILLSAWCFLKSSKRAHDWLYRQPLFGPTLIDWEKNRSIKRPTKILAISMILGSLIFLWLGAATLWLKCVVTALLLGVSLYISTRNEGN